MSCFGGSSEGGKIAQVPKLTEAQMQLVNALATKALPGVQNVPERATVPGQELAPTGPSSLQQLGFNLGQNLPNIFAAGPSGISQAMKPVADYALNRFRRDFVPSIMGALGAGGAARSSGAADILTRGSEDLLSNIAAQFAPLQFQGQMNLPQTLTGLGQLQRGIGEEQRQFNLTNFLQQAPEQSPLLNLIGPAFTSAYDTAVEQGVYSPGLGTQLLGFGSNLLGGMAMGGTGFFA